MEITFFLIILGLAGGYVGWNIGANDSANCIGTSVGSGITTFRRARYLVIFFVMLGAFLQGHLVMKTLGKGIVTADLPEFAVLVALLSSGIFVTLATFFRVPVSTSQALVAGVAGVGVGVFGFTGEQIAWKKLLTILECWIASPILAMILSFIIYRLLIFIIPRIRNKKRLDQILTFLVLISAAYVAYSLGANDVGNAMGPLFNLFPENAQGLALFGGITMGLGVLTYGQKVTNTV
ncbi:MAG: anion permease, partial [Candidatus Eremiobacteraeota bacterium]|nr:anion permease [Candidatus Eremiobacteraeota bacterium]